MHKIKPIEYDADMDRFYIPVNSRYEIQTKGKGSSFRIANTETHIRVIVLNDSLHHVLEDMAKATNAEMMQLQAKLSKAEAEKAELVKAAKAVVDRWHTPLWKEAPHTAEFINRLENALKDKT
jgi:predicted DNA-binding ribbon-helix-helix protein